MRLVATYKGHPADALLNADGSIIWDETVYPTQSAAGAAVGSGRAANGLAFWAIEGDNGKMSLATLRSRLGHLVDRRLGFEATSGQNGTVFSSDDLQRLVNLPAESEGVEFKAARKAFEKKELRRYCVAIANSGGGYLVLGVTDNFPRQVVGTGVWSGNDQINKLKLEIRGWLHTPASIHEVDVEGQRVLVFEIPKRPQGRPLNVDGSYLTRVGESIVAMTPEQLKAVLSEGDPGYLEEVARGDLSGNEVVALLDTQRLFDGLNRAYPTTQQGVLDFLVASRLVFKSRSGSFAITNMGALVLAKSLTKVAPELGRRAPRLIVYANSDRTQTAVEVEYDEGFAVCFERIVDFVFDAAPRNQVVEESLRAEFRMFPKQAIRELLANAFVHQDFSFSDSTLRIEMFSDRLEISNPGQPAIDVKRFVDQDRSRNEVLANLMRRLGVCEQKGSGIDKVLTLSEFYQLPPPLFDSNDRRTRAVLYSYQDFSDMNRDERIRACYLHCCLKWVMNETMTNRSLRQRFGLSERKTAIVSQIINQTKAEGLIRDQDGQSRSLRYASYVPHWA